MRAAVLLAPVPLLLALACDGGGSGGTAGGGSGGAGGAGASGGAGGGGVGGGLGGNVAGCEPACVSPQTCGVTGVCIDPGTCLADGDCKEPGTVCDLATSACVPGGMCGGQEAKIDAVPPNLLVVLDRSCSMTDLVGGQTKWEIAVAALVQMTTAYQDQIRFGLTLFPDLTGGNCAQDAIPIPTAPGNEAAIQSLLTASLANADPYFPNGPCVTNIDTAMQQAQTDPALVDPTRDNFVLLLTDGKQSGSCGGNAADPITVQTIAALLGADVKTFVIGFGSGVDPANLNEFANAGGVPSMGANAFYDAGDQAQLDAALTAIAEATLSCTFDLDMVPPNADEIFVWFDNVTKVASDPVDGWTYDPALNQVTFYGASCAALKSGSVTDVDIVFGCDVPTPA